MVPMSLSPRTNPGRWRRGRSSLTAYGRVSPYDARKETPGWNEAGYKDQQWAQPLVVSGPAGELRSQMVEPIKITDSLVAKRAITEPRPRFVCSRYGQEYCRVCPDQDRCAGRHGNNSEVWRKAGCGWKRRSRRDIAAACCG